VQPSETPSVRETVAALERLALSDEIRQIGVHDHTYPLRAADEQTVETFAALYGELPPRGYWRSLLWHLRS
jgi:hypothetical protein